MNHVLRSCFGHVRGWLAACALGAFLGNVAYAATAAGDTFPKTFTGQVGQAGAIWRAPGNVIGAASAASGVRVWSQTATGVRVTESGSVLLEQVIQATEGRQTLAKIVEATIAASREVSAAEMLAAARGGPWAVAGSAALLIALPAFKTWIDEDNAQNIRVNSHADGFEKKSASTAPVSSGWEYQMPDGTWTKAPTVACNASADQRIASGNWPDIASYTLAGDTGPYDGGAHYWCSFDRIKKDDWGGGHSATAFTLQGQQSPSCPAGWFIKPDGTCTPTADGNEWLPASMDDIAPYMTNKPVPLALPQQILDKGGTLNSTPGGTTGPASPVLMDPRTYVEQVPTPSSSVTDNTRQGNPYNLPSNTPTVTSSGSGSAPVQMPDGTTIQNPSTTKRTSVFNPTSNTTSDHTETTYDPLRRETTSSTSTTINYGPNSVSTNTTTNNTTNIINNTTNQVIKTDSTSKDATQAPDTQSECEKNPNTVGCLQPGDPPSSDQLNKTTKDFQFSPVVFASSVSCPSPLTFSLTMAGVEGTYSIPYDGVCAFMGLIKVLVVAMGAFAAAWIVADEFRVA